MTGWLIPLLISVAVLGALWRFAALDRTTLQFVASALLLALAGYAWQGSPDLAGSPKRAPVRQKLPDSEFASIRQNLLGRFDTADRWLTIADSYQRGGDSRNAAGVIRAGLRAHPRDADLWVGLGNALVIHADGMMNPAAQLAFQRAATIAPEHPGPKFFYGLALAQSGRIDDAERIWRELLASAPPSATWRGAIEERLAMIAEARAMGAAER